MRHLIVSLALISAASPAFAGQDDDRTTSTTRIETSILRGIYVGTFAVHAYEAQTSLDVFAVGGRELDPVLRPLSSHPTAFRAANLARAAAIDLGVHAIARNHRIVAIAVGLAINAGFLAIAAHNRQVEAMMTGVR